MSVGDLSGLAGPTATRPAAGRLWRAPLAAKLASGFIGLVAFVLIVNGAVDAVLSYSQAKQAALEVQSEKARAAAERVGEFLEEIQTELGWTAGVEWGYSKPEQQRYDFIRLLRQAPAITALSFIDGEGHEQLAVSRLAPDAVGSGKDFSADPRFLRAVADKVWFGPVEFRRGSEPYMTVALAHVGKNPGVTVADVNLKLVWDLVSAIHVGDRGFAYVVDDYGRLIAHPDLSLVLRDTDFSHLPQVAAALSGPGASEAEVARSLDGLSVLTAHAVMPKTHWTVFVEQPLAEALATAYRSLLRSVALLGLGLTLAAVSGVALARRMAAPIRLLQSGAEKLGAGDLAQRLDIRTGDEIEALAGGFNRMAERLQESYENLEGKVEARTKDLNDALAQQTATADVLKVISRSAFDLNAVFDTLLKSALALVGAEGAVIALRDDEGLRVLAAVSVRPEEAQQILGRVFPIDRTSVPGRAVLSGRYEYLPHADQDREFVRRGAPGTQSFLAVPLMRDGRAEGAVLLVSLAIQAFTPRHIELAQTFADQAVIAIQNVRLFEAVQAKTHEVGLALGRQIATSEILRVISQSPTDAKPVFDSIVVAAARLLHCEMAFVMLVEGDSWRNAAAATPEGLQAVVLADKLPVDPALNFPSRAIVAKEMVYLPDWSKLELPEHQLRVQSLYGFQSSLHLPFLREDECVGVLTLLSRRAHAFGDAEIAQSQAFRDQAVIAIENARLFEEVQARTREITVSLERQTATSEILRVISASPTDVKPVFDAIALTATRLFHSEVAAVLRIEGDNLVFVTAARSDRLFREDELPLSILIDPDANFPSRAVVGRRTVHIPDFSTIELPDRQRDIKERFGFNSGLYLPLLREGECIGVFLLNTAEANVFGDRDIALAESFRDQAQIAIENTRLFNETKESLAQQTATADVLKVISRSAFDLQKVLDTLVASAATLCEAEKACIFQRRGELYYWESNFGFSNELEAYAQTHPFGIGGGSTTSRVVRDKLPVHIPDVLADPDYKANEYQRLGDYRTMLGVPLLRDGEPVGVFIMTRHHVRPFNARQIELLQTFSDQAVIAIENARLFDEVQARTRELQASLDDLRKTQDRLVQSEKLASLGQLTAGIAHEIKNPLNFVNNFSALSRELLEELRETLLRLPEDVKAEADDLLGLIDSNLEKVVSHGKRADSIVKNMLLHSREGSGERTRVNINAMVEEALNLGYHGARAEKPSFNVTLEKDFDPKAGEANLYLQEVTRVLLNLISNGFYASAKRAVSEGAGYAPTLWATTRDRGHNVEIRIRDNGAGIPDEVRAKMFNPFFTTKPAGEGTGLGLSLSHDIVVKQHGGTLDVETEPRAFTEFILTLPREGAEGAKS